MSGNSNEVFTGGATTSQHIEAQDDDHFNNTTFKLKRTRSLGLLDEFINPLEKAQGSSDSTATADSATIDSAATNEPSAITGSPILELSVLPASPVLSPEPKDNLSVNTSTDNTLKAAEAADIADPADADEAAEDSGAELKKQVSATFKSPDFVPHDDNDIEIEPSLHVDYLSHQWDVSDISKSWRYIIQKRKDVANSARLENASWRTWAQRRLNLKTIDPEELNWSKENDITWLYGPILKDDPESSDDEDSPHHHKNTTASSKVAGDISIPNKNTKGILKKRSVQDIMISHANLVKLEAIQNRLKARKEEKEQQLRRYREKMKGHQRNSSNEPPEFDDYDAISEKLNSQYNVRSNQNSLVNLVNLNEENKTANETKAAASTDISHLDLDDVSNSQKDVEEEVSETKSIDSKKERRIHFNDVVEQCIAVDYVSDNSDYNSVEDSEDDYDTYNSSLKSYIYTNPHETDYDETFGDNEGDDGDEEDDDDDDDDDGFFLNVKSPSSSEFAPQLVNREKQAQDKKVLDLSLDGSSIESQKSVDSESISTTNSKLYRTIRLLPSTSLNYGSEEDTSDDDNPYTSSMSHNVNNNSSRGYDYYYDYNTVYTSDPNTYGVNAEDDNTPPVIDLPEDLAPYSSYDTPAEESSLPIINSSIINNNNINYGSHEPTESPNTSAPSPGGFSFNDSDSDSSESEDEGLSISTRSSSQSLAQQAYQSMTPAFPNNDHRDNEKTNEKTNENTNESAMTMGYSPAPVLESIQSINPRHLSTGLSKQSTSSNSLSSQFFGTTPLNKDLSSTSLADQFFNAKPSEMTLERPSPKSTYPPTHSKSSPLPPHTTSANAFLGNTTPPLETQRKSTSAFSFDSDSDSEDEFVENADVGSNRASSSSPSYSSYNSLSQVAGKSGIGSPGHEDKDQHDKNLVNQAKGLATHFLGNWKSNE